MENTLIIRPPKGISLESAKAALLNLILKLSIILMGIMIFQMNYRKKRCALLKFQNNKLKWECL